MHIAIVGAGSIGCYLGGCLATADTKVTFIGRERIRKELEAHGLRVTDWQGRDATLPAQQLHYTTDISAIENAEVVLVTVKSPHTAEAALEISKHIRPGTIVVSFQNGLRNAWTLKKHISNNLVLAGMVPFNVSHQGQGHFHCGTEGVLAIEQARGIEKLFVASLAAAGLPCHIHKNMLPVQWGKLLMNLNNPINALAGIPLVEELQNKGYRKVLAASMREALAVLKTAGIKPARTGKVFPAVVPFMLELPDWLFSKVANTMLKIDPQATSSMQEDLSLGRFTEVDYLNGEIIRLGEEHGLATPVNRAIARLIHEAEEAREGSPRLSSESLLGCISNRTV